jgi:DNA-binding NtrC family response regulator
MNLDETEEVTLPAGSKTVNPVVAAPKVVKEPVESDVDTVKSLPTLAQVEKEYILHVLKHCKNNKTEAVKTLGITLKSLYNKLHEYGEFENFAKTKKT